MPEEESETLPWPHAPLHVLQEAGTYYITAATLNHTHVFRSRKRLRILHHALLEKASHFGWQLEAWAVFSNHYHFVAHSPKAESGAESLPTFLGQLHSGTAEAMNLLDDTPGRQVWHNYWELRLTRQRSYLARLNYVHHNAVKHELVPVANQYPWCSASWFERTASPAMVTSIYRFKTDRLEAEDDFDVYRG
tara:strand:+ start:1990 stop:2565 length:576 start_codon:yes stop_codon:yes gene_type:complete